jgi:hypothetical protein
MSRIGLNLSVDGAVQSNSNCSVVTASNLSSSVSIRSYGFCNAVSAWDYFMMSSSASVRAFAKSGSSLSVAIGSSKLKCRMSVLDFVRVSSSFSTRAFTKAAANVSIVSFMRQSSCLSL